MADLQTFGQHAHRRHLMPFESLDLEQHEILLRLHPRRAGGDFADAKKASYLIAEIREGSIIDRTEGHGGHAPASIYHLMICLHHFVISLAERSARGRSRLVSTH